MVTTGNITLDSNICTGKCKFTKVGKVVNITGDITMVTNTTGTVYIFANFQYPPSNDITVPCPELNSGNVTKYISIFTNGSLMVFSPGTGYRFLFSETYITP
jgi:hypothetical protein